MLPIAFAALSPFLHACVSAHPTGVPATQPPALAPGPAREDLAHRLERALATGPVGSAGLESLLREETLKAGRGGAAVVTSNVEHEGIPFGPEDLEGVVEAALRYQRAEGDLARANGAYSLAIMLQPANPRLYAERSSVRWKLGQQQAARDDVRVVRTLAGVDADAWERRDASIQAAISRMPVAEISDLQGDAFARVDWPGPVARIQDVDPREGEHVYGLRFVTPEAPAKLVWAFVPPEGLANWYILPATGIMRGFDSFEKHEGEVNLGGQRQRKVADLQSLHQTYLEPRAEYAIYFGFKDDAPRRLWYTIGLIPQ